MNVLARTRVGRGLRRGGGVVSLLVVLGLAASPAGAQSSVADVVELMPGKSLLASVFAQ